MLNLLRKRWWKYVSVALLLFALVAGMYFPLGPGITSVSPEKLNGGTDISLKINTYNTHFASSSPRVLLKADALSFCSDDVQIVSPNRLLAKLQLPETLGFKGQKPFSLLVDDADNGTFFLSGAVTIVGSGAATDQQYNCADGLLVKAAPGFTFPYREILYESIRNLFYHVPMWFAMVLLLLFSFGSSIAYLATNKLLYDVFAKEAALVGLLFGALGIVTGMMWANFTWGAPWVNDPKLNGAAVGMLVYLAYFVLRGSLNQKEQRAKVSAVYGIFAFVIYILFIFVLPRLNDSLHPGNGGNPAFSNYDLDNSLRPIFYSAVFGFAGIGYWIMSIRIRYTLLQEKRQEALLNQSYESLVS